MFTKGKNDVKPNKQLHNKKKTTYRTENRARLSETHSVVNRASKSHCQWKESWKTQSISYGVMEKKENRRKIMKNNNRREKKKVNNRPTKQMLHNTYIFTLLLAASYAVIFLHQIFAAEKVVVDVVHKTSSNTKQIWEKKRKIWWKKIDRKFLS